MYLFYSDETNLDPDTTEYFVYGGIGISAEYAAVLSGDIGNIRKNHKVPPDFLLKFNPCPDNICHEEFSILKQEIVEAAARANCKLFLSVIMHKISKGPDIARRYEINRNLYHFNCFLNHIKDHGIVLVDRFTDTQIDAQLRERFSIGVKGLPFSPEYRLEKILGFHYSCIGQSHFSSLIDIAIGSFRFSVNAFSKTDIDRLPTARILLGILKPLFYMDKFNNKISDISLHFSPDYIQSKKYREQYRSLKEFFSECGINTMQEIIDSARY